MHHFCINQSDIFFIKVILGVAIDHLKKAMTYLHLLHASIMTAKTIYVLILMSRVITPPMLRHVQVELLTQLLKISLRINWNLVVNGTTVLSLHHLKKLLFVVLQVCLLFYAKLSIFTIHLCIFNKKGKNKKKTCVNY